MPTGQPQKPREKPPAGSAGEVLETANVVGWPGAFLGLTSNDVDRLIRKGLIWES